ncbi:MAG: hypothetical protein M3384_00225 [Acidobacteriota bacterium]|nr:hypothetical protein [Acidobacteriota bacterium]
MRTATFLGICGFISFGLVILLQAGLAYLGIAIPYINGLIFKTIEIAVLVPLVALILNPLNQKIRLRRKRRGRDIEAEERHETETGFISLVPKDEK